MYRRRLLTTTTTLVRQALTQACCCRWMLLFSLAVLLFSPAGVPPAGLQATFFFIFIAPYACNVH